MSSLLVLTVLAASCSLGHTNPSTPSPAPHTLQEASHRLDMILNNTRSRENYIRCFMDRGICNKEALSIKRILSEALASNCTNCTQVQRLGAERFFEYLQAHQPDTWVSLSGKYGHGDHDHDDSDSEDDDDDDVRDRKGGLHSQGAGEGMEEMGGGNGTFSKGQTTPTPVVLM